MEISMQGAERFTEIHEEILDDDDMTDEARELRDRMAGPQFQGGDCDHGGLVWDAPSRRVQCTNCSLEFVEADYAIEAMARIESRMAFAEGLARGFVESAAEGMKQLAASPAGIMLGIDASTLNLPAILGGVVQGGE